VSANAATSPLGVRAPDPSPDAVLHLAQAPNAWGTPLHLFEEAGKVKWQETIRHGRPYECWEKLCDWPSVLSIGKWQDTIRKRWTSARSNRLPLWPFSGRRVHAQGKSSRNTKADSMHVCIKQILRPLAHSSPKPICRKSKREKTPYGQLRRHENNQLLFILASFRTCGRVDNFHFNCSSGGNSISACHRFIDDCFYYS